MKKITYIILTAVVSSGIMADTVNFTSAEGYVDGILQRNAKWNGGGDSFTVDSSSGTVTMGNKGWNKSVYRTPLEAGKDSYTVGIAFRFDKGKNPESVKSIMSAEFTTVDSPSGGSRLTLHLNRFANGTYRLGVYDSSAPSHLTSNSGAQERQVFSNGGNTSDELWLEMTVTRGKTADTWDISGVVRNLTTGAMLNSISVSGHKTAAYKGKFFGALNTLEPEADSFVSNRKITRFEVH